MGTGTALALLLLIAASGYIAYIGDLIGRRMGKRRLSLFGMRPKHTAILITIWTGVVIAAATVGVAMSIVPGFRQVILEGEELAAKNASLRTDNTELTQQYQKSQTAAANLETQLTTLRGQETKLRELNKREQQLNTRLEGQNAELKRQNAEFVRVTNQLRQARQRLTRTNVQLTRSNGNLHGEIGRLEQRRRQLASNVRKLTSDNTRLARELSDVKKIVAQEQKSYRALQKLNQDLSHTASRYKSEDPLYSDGYEIERRIIPANPPAGFIKHQLTAMLFAAERYAREEHTLRTRFLKPVGDPVPMPEPIVRLANIRTEFRTQRDDGTDVVAWSRDMPVDETLLAKAAEEIEAIRGPIFIRVVAAQNTLLGATVPLKIIATNNRVRLRKGVEIAADVFDPSGDEEAIFNEIYAFMRRSVSPAARARGITPKPNGEVIELNAYQLLQLARKIKTVPGMARMGVVARDDTSESGPLHLDFYVVPESVAAGG